jgi:hypothetical protein
MRLSVMPLAGTVSAKDEVKHSNAHSPNVDAADRRAERQVRFVMVMVFPSQPVVQPKLQARFENRRF